MATTDAYKLRADASFPQAIRKADELADGTVIYETVGRNYAAGSYILKNELSPPDQKRAENGDLDHLLEPATAEDAANYRAENNQQYGVFIPEHSAEAAVLSEYGHQIVPRDQVIEMNSAGEDAAREAMEASKEGAADAREGLGLGQNANRVDPSVLAGVERPPGVPVGADKAMAEGASAEDAAEEAQAASERPDQEEAPKPRSRPQSKASDK